jgi:cell wall-associated NlpC family hydrolase
MSRAQQAALRRRHGLLLAAALLAGCGAVPVPRPAPVSTPTAPPAPPAPSARPSQPQRNDVTLYAMGLLDTRYSRGGRGPATGFDCSGLVSHVFQEAIGLRVQGSSAELGKKARPVAPDQLLPGDLVFFNTLGARHSHVGVYVGDGRFVHASNPRTGVRIDQLSNRYYAQRFEGAGTLLD